jgi:peptide deformylase
MDKPWNILTNPDPRLRARSKEVDAAYVKTPEFQTFADDLAAYMIASDGVGLAAPQIGVSERVIAVLEREKVSVYANPEILKKSPAMQIDEEGCLSVPGVYGTVERHKRVRVRALDRHGRRVEFDAANFQAVIFQHEIDHLDGILFIDKVKEITRGNKKSMRV